MGENEETEMIIEGLASGIWTNEIRLQSVATSLFDVQRWTFDVRCSVCSTLNLKTTLYGIHSQVAFMPYGIDFMISIRYPILSMVVVVAVN
jgi:hypothetical protein